MLPYIKHSLKNDSNDNNDDGYGIQPTSINDCCRVAVDYKSYPFKETVRKSRINHEIYQCLIHYSGNKNYFVSLITMSKTIE